MQMYQAIGTHNGDRTGIEYTIIVKSILFLITFFPDIEAFLICLDYV